MGKNVILHVILIAIGIVLVVLLFKRNVSREEKPLGPTGPPEAVPMQSVTKPLSRSFSASAMKRAKPAVSGLMPSEIGRRYAAPPRVGARKGTEIALSWGNIEVPPAPVPSLPDKLIAFTPDTVVLRWVFSLGIP